MGLPVFFLTHVDDPISPGVVHGVEGGDGLVIHTSTGLSDCRVKG